MSDATAEEQLHDTLFDVLREAKEFADSGSRLVHAQCPTPIRLCDGSIQPVPEKQNINVEIFDISRGASACARTTRRAVQQVQAADGLPDQVGTLRRKKWITETGDALKKVESFPTGVKKWIDEQRESPRFDAPEIPIWTAEQWKPWADGCGKLYLRIIDLRIAYPLVGQANDRARGYMAWPEHCREILGVESFGLLALHKTSDDPAYWQALRAILKRYELATITPRFLKARIEHHQSRLAEHDATDPRTPLPAAALRRIADDVHSCFSDARPLDLHDAPDTPGTDEMGPRAADALLEKLRKSIIRRMNSQQTTRHFVSRSEAAVKLNLHPGRVTKIVSKFPSMAESDERGSRVDFDQLREHVEAQRIKSVRDQGIRDRATDEANRDARKIDDDE